MDEDPFVKGLFDPKHIVALHERGHDCPGMPEFNPDVGLWMCNHCDWTSVITTEDCHICGCDADSPPHPLPRDQFISFNDPHHQKVLSMHVSCAIQVYLSLRFSFEDPDDDPSGGGIP